MRQNVRSLVDILWLDVVAQINQAGMRGDIEDHGLHDANIAVGQTEIRGQ